MGEADWGTQARAARAALRAGRIDELVRLVVPMGNAAARWGVEGTDQRLRLGSLLQATFRFTGRHDVRDLALEVLGPAADELGDVPEAVSARALMASVHLLAGTYHRCYDLCQAAVALAEAAEDEPTAGVAMAHQFAGYVAFEWGRFGEARLRLETAWHLAGVPAAGIRSGVARVLAMLSVAEGDPAGAERWLSAVTEVVSEPMTLRNREWLAAVRARVLLGEGDVRAVEAWLRSGGYAPGDPQALGDAWILGRLGEMETIMSLLEATSQWRRGEALARAVAAASAGRRAWFHARAASTAAVCAEHQGRKDESRQLWDAALESGVAGSLGWAYLDGNEIRSDTLRALAEEGDVRAARVLAADPRAGEPGLAVHSLSPRQLEVLRRVERGQSNKAIARDLRLSVSTVKTHLREAFARLDARSRTEAVARARDLGAL